MKDYCIVSFPAQSQQAQQLAATAACKYYPLGLHQFPDGESLVTVPVDAREAHWIVLCSLDHPNSKLIELLMLSQQARRMNKQLSLVAPYLCYMRQDQQNHPGEVVSQQVIGQLLADCFSQLYTLDAHLHRIDSLSQAIPSQKAINEFATTVITDYINTHWPAVVLLGPDAESQQWVQQIAAPLQCEYIIGKKRRLGDRQLDMHIPVTPDPQKVHLIVDDMISTGHTIELATQQLLAQGVKEIHCIVTHALCSDVDEQKLLQAGLRSLISCDTVKHPSNQISVLPLLQQAVQQLVQ